LLLCPKNNKRKSIHQSISMTKSTIKSKVKTKKKKIKRDRDLDQGRKIKRDRLSKDPNTRSILAKWKRL